MMHFWVSFKERGSRTKVKGKKEEKKKSNIALPQLGVEVCKEEALLYCAW